MEFRLKNITLQGIKKQDTNILFKEKSRKKKVSNNSHNSQYIRHTDIWYTYKYYKLHPHKIWTHKWTFTCSSECVSHVVNVLFP